MLPGHTSSMKIIRKTDRDINRWWALRARFIRKDRLKNIYRNYPVTQWPGSRDGMRADNFPKVLDRKAKIVTMMNKRNQKQPEKQ